jgi:hypothetical protein
VVFQHRKKSKNDEGLLSMVFQQREKAKQLLDGVVSSMKYGEEMVDCSVLGVGRKSVEQWCFSIGEKVNSAEQWCFSIGK